MGSKLKPGGVRRHLKEKVVQMYEDLFHGVDPCINNSRFWEDLYLLKVESCFLCFSHHDCLHLALHLFSSQSYAVMELKDFDINMTWLWNL